MDGIYIEPVSNIEYADFPDEFVGMKFSFGGRETKYIPIGDKAWLHVADTNYWYRKYGPVALSPVLNLVVAIEFANPESEFEFNLKLDGFTFAKSTYLSKTPDKIKELRDSGYWMPVAKIIQD